MYWRESRYYYRSGIKTTPPSYPIFNLSASHSQVLNIIRARAYPKATEHIQDIENMVQQLIDNGNAYLENGSVYFRVSSFPQYGQLANLKADSIRDGSGEFGPNERRGTTEKESSRDFALWKVNL